MNTLSRDIFFEIAKRLSFDAIGQVATLNTTFSNWSKSDTVWKYMCVRDHVQLFDNLCFLDAYKLIKLVPIYVTSDDVSQPFGFLKPTYLRSPNRFLENIMFSNSFIVITTRKFEFVGFITMVKNCVYIDECDSNGCVWKKLGTEPLLAFWITRSTDSKVGALLDSFIRSSKKINTILYDMETNLKTVISQLAIPKVQLYKNLPILNGLNITFPTDPIPKNQILSLTNRGMCCIFCNQSFKEKDSFWQVICLTSKGKPEFYVFI